jgi:hypothetical protein
LRASRRLSGRSVPIPWPHFAPNSRSVRLQPDLILRLNL